MKSNRELDEEERKVSVSQRILCSKGEERWDGVTCDLQRTGGKALWVSLPTGVGGWRLAMEDN